MRIGLIVANNLWTCPYVNIYTNILNSLNLTYDLIVWDRELSEQTLNLRFSYIPNQNRWLKFFDYFKYSKYVKNIIKKNKYDKLIIFGQAIGIFLQPFLIKYYKGKYILDYRDVGIDRIALLKNRFISLVNNSFCTVVSSPGFIQFLPKGNHYYLSHNFNEENARRAIFEQGQVEWPPETINILTIGSIRDFESNSQIIKALGNIKGFSLSFIGKGPKSKLIHDYSKSGGYSNVFFKGKYEKFEEATYVSNSSYINLFQPEYENRSTLMANRFYLALIHRKPMIVTKNSTQSEYVEKYNLGVSIKNTDNLCILLREWYENNSQTDFKNRCNNLLRVLLKDYEVFKEKVVQFLELQE